MPHLTPVLVLRLGALMLGLAAGTAPARADTPFGPARCLARSYDAAHLAAHPRQLVTRLMLLRTSDAPAGTDLALRVIVTLRDGDTFEGRAACRDGRCLMEGDGGGFLLREGPRGIELAVGDALVFENARRFSPDLARSDDRLFRLAPSPRCR